MPRDNDKDNDSRGRRDRPSGGKGRAGGGKGRSGAARGPEKKFAKRGFAGKSDGDKPDGERRPYAGKPDGARSFDKKPYAGGGKPYAGKRDGDRPPRRDFDAPRPPRGDRPFRDRSRRAAIVRHASTARIVPVATGRLPAVRPAVTTVKSVRSNRAKTVAARSARTRRAATARTSIATTVRRAGTARAALGIATMPVRPRVLARRNSARSGLIRRGRRWRREAALHAAWRRFPQATAIVPRGDRPERKFGGDKKFSSRGAPDRGPRKNFGDRPTAAIQSRGRSARIAANAMPVPPATARAISTSRASTSPATTAAARSVRASRVRARIAPPAIVRNSIVRVSAPEGRTDWQEHPRSEPGDERPRRENEDDSKIFAKRPAFGGRGAYRERKTEFEKRGPQPPKVKKSGERIAKVVSRAGLASRRDAEEWVTQGRVSVNGRVINSPALDVTANDVITVDGKPLPPRERTRLFMFHKPRGLMTTHADPEGRPTVFDNLPEGLPRLISIGRLDFNTEGLLLLTNDGGLARALELPDTGWLRRYRVRAHGEVTQAQLDELKKGVEVDGVKYGSIDATLERDQGANVWLVFAIREGKNREVRNVMAHLGLEVNRLIRVSYGPFQLGELAEGQVEEVKTRVLREQLGEKIAALAGADFNRPMPGDKPRARDDAPRGKKPFKPAGKSG